MMDLPIINGASEGTLSCGLFLAFSAIFGFYLWFFFKFRNWFLDLWNLWYKSECLDANILLYIICNSSACRVKYSIILYLHLFYRYRNIYKHDNKNFVNSIVRTLFGYFVIGGVMYTILFSPHNIGETHYR